jgi:hypothetical protein
MERNETPFCHRQSTPDPRFPGVCRSAPRQNEPIMSPKTGTPAAATERNQRPSNELADVAGRGPPTKRRNPRAADPDVAGHPHRRRQNRERNAAAIRETELAKTGAKTGAGIYVGYQSSAQEVILVNVTITENVAFKGPPSSLPNDKAGGIYVESDIRRARLSFGLGRGTTSARSNWRWVKCDAESRRRDPCLHLTWLNTRRRGCRFGRAAGGGSRLRGCRSRGR